MNSDGARVAATYSSIHATMPYTLYHAASGAPVARLRQTRQDNRVEVLYWSLWKERWTNARPFGRTFLRLDEALRLVASEDIFGAAG